MSVFISSRMVGRLEEVRAIVEEKLNERGIEAFVYELDEGARAESPETVSLERLDDADLVVLILEDSYGEITEREFDRARERNQPCLVYRRDNVEIEDPRLQRFIEKLSGARNVPSRKGYRNGVELANRVAADIQAWLVREYRRLSAELQQYQGTPEAPRRGETVARLQAIGRGELPHGTAADMLAGQLADWFTASRYTSVSAATPSEHGVELVVDVPVQRRRVHRTLVRAKDGEIQARDVTVAEDQLAKDHPEVGRIDEVWIVAFRRVSQSARQLVEKSRGVYVYTLDELIEEDIDFSRYFDWLEREIRTQEIERFYVPLACSIQETAEAGADAPTNTYDDVGDYVDLWLTDPANEHLSLFGEFGTGKTWFTLKYAHDLVRKYREAQEKGLPRPRIPLIVQLRNYAQGFKDVGALLTDFVFREHDIGIPNFACVEVLNRMGRLLLVFDGFDEMAARVNRQKMVDNFWALAAVLGPGSKAILTCRTEHFYFAEQARGILRGEEIGSRAKNRPTVAGFQVAHLEMFDEERLRKVLSSRADGSVVDEVLASPRLVDLGKRPVMVELLVEAIPGLRGGEANMATVYYEAIKRKLLRDSESGRTFTSLADKLFFLCELSWEMLSSDRLSIHFKDMPDKIRAYFGSAVDSQEEDHWRSDLLSQTVLVRGDDDLYRPAHRSFAEFFVAYKQLAETGALASRFLDVAASHASADSEAETQDYRWSSWFRGSGRGEAARQPLGQFSAEPLMHLPRIWGQAFQKSDAAVKELLAELVDTGRLAAVLRSCSNSQPRLAGSLLELLARSDGASHVKLSNLSLVRSTLSHTDLSGASLKSCRLTNVDWNRCDLTDTDFSASTFKDGSLAACSMAGANFEGSRFEGFRIQATVSLLFWCLRGGEEVLAVVADSRLLLIDPARASIVEHSIGVVQKELLTDEADSVESFARQLEASDTSKELELIPPGISSELRQSWETNITPTGPDGNIYEGHLKITRRLDGATVAKFRTFDTTSSPQVTFDGFRSLVATAPSGRLFLCFLGEAAGSGYSLKAVVMAPTTEVHPKPLATLEGFGPSHTRRVLEHRDNRPASFSPSERYVAMAEAQDRVAVWETETGSLILRLEIYPNLAGAKIDDSMPISEAAKQAVRSGGDLWNIVS